jgi:hypothetical protein
MKLKKTTKATWQATRLHLAYAASAYFQQQRDMHADTFATQTELDRILAEPLEHLDLLPYDVRQFVQRMLNA